MRAAIVVSALWAAVAMATPALHKRAVVTHYRTQVEVVTQMVTVRAQRTRYRPHGGRHSTRTITIQAPAEPTLVVDQPGGDETTSSSSSSSSTFIDAPEPTTSTEEPAKTTPVPEPTPTTEQDEPSSTSIPQGTTRPGDDASYQELCLFHHNEHRRNHSAPALVWDDDLANSARILAETCVFDHDKTIGGGGYGQNLAASTGFDIGKALSDQLYNGEFSHYAPFGPISKQGMTGHLTQMIWVASSRLGCYTHHCANGIQKTSFAGYYTVCNYDPTGNMYMPGRDLESENVLPPLGLPVLRG